MTRPIDTETEVNAFAIALQSTTDRYQHGCLSHATWKSHMESLWGTVRARGIRNDVIAVLDPESPAVRRFQR